MRSQSSILLCATPRAWLEHASSHPVELLSDHAACERKAAATACKLINHYPEYPALVQRMLRLTREELKHFEQVCALAARRGVQLVQVPASRYAKGLRAAVRTHEPARLTDLLLIGAFIEARSSERFAALVPYLDDELGGFYAALAAAEQRHFEQYLQLALDIASVPLDERVRELAEIERDLVLSEDPGFAFHSGAPPDLRRAATRSN